MAIRGTRRSLAPFDGVHEAPRARHPAETHVQKLSISARAWNKRGLMISIVQRVSRASVSVDQQVIGRIALGYVVLAGFETGDGSPEVEASCLKLQSLRAFPGKTPMDRDIADVGGSILLISQFTLAGRLRRGRRPSFDRALDPDPARELYDSMAVRLRELGIPVETGRFAAHMHVDLVNDGPVTLVLRARDGQIVDA